MGDEVVVVGAEPHEDLVAGDAVFGEGQGVVDVVVGSSLGTEEAGDVDADARSALSRATISLRSLIRLTTVGYATMRGQRAPTCVSRPSIRR